MKKEDIAQIVHQSDRNSKYSLIYEKGVEYYGTFHYGHFDVKLADNLKYEFKNQWLFDFKPGFGKGYTVLLEGEKIYSVNLSV